MGGGFSFLAVDLSDANATSPKRLTAALTDSKGALVSISALGESIEFCWTFVPMLLFLTCVSLHNQ